LPDCSTHLSPSAARAWLKHGLHMGTDVARGPDQIVFYVAFGNAWLRP